MRARRLHSHRLGQALVSVALLSIVSLLIGAGTSAAAVTVTQNTYGQTPDATVAVEFEAAFPNGSTSAVIATDAAPWDGLAGAYLEGQLGTGLLITPPTGLGPDAATALQIEGVQTVYVLGNMPAVASALASTPAYNFGGTTKTGANLQVVGPIFGSDGTVDGDAQQIATYKGPVGLGNFSAAYSGAGATSGGGLYNDTVGTGSATGPGTAQPTAIVIADNDFQDSISASVMAYRQHFPVILTPNTSLSNDAANALTTLGIKQVILMGGQLALTNSVFASIQALNGGISVLRIAGQDGTDTAAQLANFELAGGSAGLSWAPGKLLVAQGAYWSDPLGAAPMGGTTQEPIILTEDPLTVGPYTTTLLNQAGSAAGLQGHVAINTLVILGGPLAVASSTVSALSQALSV